MCGVDERDAGPRAGDDGEGSVRFARRLPRDEYRTLLRRARVFVTAPRREDHGIAQLEALADGCVLVTTTAPGPYVALPLARALDPRLVVPAAGTGAAESEIVDGLAVALRAALDDPRPGYAGRAAAELAPFAHTAVDLAVAGELLPRLLNRCALAQLRELRPRARVGDVAGGQPGAARGRDAVA